jgi:hypothetical protein
MTDVIFLHSAVNTDHVIRVLVTNIESYDKEGADDTMVQLVSGRQIFCVETPGEIDELLGCGLVPMAKKRGPKPKGGRNDTTP